VIAYQHFVLSAGALQDQEDHQRYDEQNSNLCARGAKRRGKATAGAILAPLASLVIAATTAFPISSIHNHLSKA
jgi:hypothetical protein